MSSEALNSLRETLRLLMSRHAGGEKREDTYKDGFQQGLAAAIDEIDKIPATQFVALATIPPDCAIGEFYGFTETTTLYRLVPEGAPPPSSLGGSTTPHKSEEPQMVKSHEAIKAVRDGHRIARSGWNGKGMYVYQHEPNGFKPVLILRTAKGEYQPGWVFSQEDVFSDDWEIVE
ncbi:DUF2829 domain-containing protein [Aliirhizobium cellulosilyticum]|uniref:Thoeris anti-defense 2-like domain-containing protein n=1 Tax=Aliirhizobium cellulosilyticum TaxID=393664 RepID=A0A7W6Y035_9HYPH|nr:DUF2829 domain-containing protein [Rhizobium cellulosilyticum]MBB4348002.1 hypothetical protein [Rhizobium cellulosilyticum]MBB4409604.1 hypothetical protein [Rhizobium cellulosilyticum]MBB4444292.1 hypothetical protein [Rhizobium cellulosilyticum]